MFTVRDFFVIGASFQIILVVILPTRYAIMPALLLLLHLIVSTVLQSRSRAANPFLAGTVFGKTSAQLPKISYDPRAANKTAFGSQPAAEGVVVLHLGVRLNHPLGVLAPGAKEIGDEFARCNEAVLERADVFGCLGTSIWRAGERDRANTLMNVYYFRNLEGLNAFAHDPIHRQAWDAYNRVSKKLGYTHIGVFHETFYCPPGGYETVYVNTPPTLMGATSVKTFNEATGEEEWIRPVVNADTSALRSQFGRMGRAVRADEEEKKNLYY